MAGIILSGNNDPAVSNKRIREFQPCYFESRMSERSSRGSSHARHSRPKCRENLWLVYTGQLQKDVRDPKNT